MNGIFLVAIIFSLVLSVYGINCLQAQSSEPDDDICRSPQCKEYAKILRAGMDYSVDPCDNFYDFVCGNHVISNLKIDTDEDWDSILYRNTAVLKQQKEILSKKELLTDSVNLKMAKKWYQSCMDVEMIAKRGIAPVEQMLQKVGGWPIIDERWSLTAGTNWLRVLAKYHEIGVMPLFEFTLTPNCKNSNKMIPGIKWSPIEFHKSHQKLFKEVLIYVIKEFRSTDGLKRMNDQILTDMAEMAHFHESLLKIVPKKMNLLCDPKSVMTIQQFQAKFDRVSTKNNKGAIDWLKVLNDWLLNVDAKLPLTQEIRVKDIDSLYHLKSLLSKTSERTIVNYVNFQSALYFLPYYIEKMNNVFKKHHYYKSLKNARWKECIRSSPFKDVVAEEFINNHISNRTIALGTEMIDRIQASILSRITKTKWFDRKTRAHLLKKYQNVDKVIGMPGHYDSLITFDYTKIGPHYIDNLMEYYKYSDILLKRSFIANVVIDKWPGVIDPSSTNPFYALEANRIVIPVSLLTEPFFSVELPLSINYGTIGFVIGHEYSHAMDDDGIMYNHRGIYITNGDVYKNEDYKRRMECFVKQYNHYGYVNSQNKRIFVNGAASKYENFADNVGLPVTFNAFQDQLKESLNERDVMKLPCFDTYTSEQMFFIAYANYWCKTEHEDNIFLDTSHAPNKYRIIGTLSNNKEFIKAFKCSRTSTMYRKDKCIF